MEKCEMILLRQAEKQEWNLFLRQKWGAGKGKEFLGKYFLWEKTPESRNTSPLIDLLFVSFLLRAQNRF